ncbi:MAG: C1 family peptidase [Bdellovibrionales bacterium]
MEEAIAGDDCSSINLKKTLGPVRNQQDLSWCYAFTAADVLSQAMRQERSTMVGLSQDGFKKVDVSAIQMAHEFQANRTTKSLADSQSAGGYVNETLNAAINTGRVCTEEEIPSHGGKKNTVLGKVGNVVEKNSVNLIWDTPLNRQARDFSRLAWGRISSELEMRESCRPASVSLRAVSIHDRKRGFDKSGKKVGSAWSDPVSNQRFQMALDQALEQGRIAGISYAANFLQNVEGHSYHASSIIGRKKMSGKCFYLLRNSWGLNCSLYAEPYKSQCRSGEIWVERDVLLQNITDVDYIPASKRPDAKPALPPDPTLIR